MSEVVNTKELHPEVWKLFDRYVHGLLDRRGFLDGAGKYAVGGVTAVGILEALSPKYAEAQQVAPNDPRIKTERIDVSSPDGYGKVRALLARPANATGRIPAIIVIHENRGLTPHIEDVVRRAAVAGFMAIGPDALTSLGGYPGTDEVGVEMRFNAADLFSRSFTLYAFAFFGAMFSWLVWPQMLSRSAFWLVGLAWLLSTAGIITLGITLSSRASSSTPPCFTSSFSLPGAAWIIA
jgi:hypothetical protein